MAKTILVESIYKDGLTPGIKNSEAAVSSLGKKTKSSMNEIRDSVKSTAMELDDMGNRFRYLSLVAGIVSAGTLGLVGSFVNAARASEESVMKLSATSIKYSVDYAKAQKLALDLVSTGYMEMADASATVSNVLMTGIGIDKTTTLLKQALGTAILYKQNLTDTVSGSMVKFSVGLRVNRETLVDSIGAEMSAMQVWKEYATTIGTLPNKLTIVQKQLALVNEVLRQTAGNEAIADAASQTFSGTLSRLSAVVQNFKIVMGQALVPAVGTLADVLIKATTALTSFASEHAELMSALIIGSLALTLFITSFATIGAIVPMVVSGLRLTTTALATMATTSMLVIGKYLLLAAAIGGIVYGILKVTGQWDKWTNSMKNMASAIAKALGPLDKLEKKTEEVSDTVAKSFKKLADSVGLFVRDTKQDMSAWVEDHDKKVNDLKTQIGDLTDEYEKSTKKIKDSYKDAMSDMSLSHSRRVEDLQRDIAEERSKGVWADQAKIRDLERELQRENEDYALSKDEKAETRDEDLQEEEDTYDKKLAKLKKELAEEVKLETDHAVQIAEIRKWNIETLDEFEKKQQSVNDRIVQFIEDFKDLGKSASEAGAETAVGMNLGSDGVNKMKKSTDELKASLEEAKKQSDLLSTPAGEYGYAFKSILSDWITKLKDVVYWSNEAFKDTKLLTDDPDWQRYIDEWKEFGGRIGSVFQGGWDFMSGFLTPSPKKFAEGGIIPGTPSTAVPIIAHGGETVLPAGVQPINININNPSVRSDSDIYAIANQVKQVLSRQQVLKHYQ